MPDQMPADLARDAVRLAATIDPGMTEGDYPTVVALASIARSLAVIALAQIHVPGTEWDEGWQACVEGFGIDDNPYLGGDPR